MKDGHEDGVASLFICSGLIAALQSGLLAGKTATAPRPMIDAPRKTHPEINWVAKRWAHDGKTWASGAPLNGIDMTKAFAIEIWGGGHSLVEFDVRVG